ncbi:SDR family oxidoreductase [Sphingopyxis sp. MSC1_008]|jgi:3-oxoacyl-[acyl-carrier protein] reductase|uniref:SDR family oxidoreductase n=1 Tax=Sphingopyxis sp. MSC1_008 TaxID=2909265 RepID=UPI0020BEA826|nr:SDR family oxidoreductase [Sphingopyxis sp. MSC1_008]
MRVALVTGASRGIGRAIALRLAADGFRVAVNYVRDETAADELISDIAKEGGEAASFRADIADLDANRALFANVAARFGRLDVLVNNAGVAELGPFSAIDSEAYDRLFAITRGTYFAMQNAIPLLEDAGRIVNISTGLTRGWAPMAAAYAGSKAAIEQFTRALSKEVGQRGITVNAVLPGVTRTDILSGASDEQLEKARQQTSFGRLGEPGDIADVVAFLASESARWITGQLIVANGGSTA